MKKTKLMNAFDPYLKSIKEKQNKRKKTRTKGKTMEMHEPLSRAHGSDVFLVGLLPTH